MKQMQNTAAKTVTQGEKMRDQKENGALEASQNTEQYSAGSLNNS